MNNQNDRATTKVAIYCRVASDNQQDNLGLEVQEYKLLDYAEKKGYKVVYRFKEQASGLTTDREMLKNILNTNLHSISKLIITEQSRISRDWQKAEIFIKNLVEKGIEVEMIELPDYAQMNNLLKIAETLACKKKCKELSKIILKIASFRV